MCKKNKNHIVILLLIIVVFALSTGHTTFVQAKTSNNTQWILNKKRTKAKKSKKKVCTKRSKVKSKRNETKTKSKKISAKTSTKVSENKKTKTVVNKILVTKTKYKKNSKMVKVTKFIITKTTVYTYKMKKASSELHKDSTSRNLKPDSKFSNSYDYPSGVYDISTLAPLANNNIINAFKELNMICKIDPTCPCTGVFSSTTGTLTIKYYGNHIYHELGHFLFWASGNLDTTQDANTIYQKEKSNVTSINKTYTNSTVNEYFAEAYRAYLLENDTLKNTRPKTYAYIEEALNAVTDTQIEYIKNIYSVIWT